MINKYSTTIPKVKIRDIIITNVNMIPIRFLVKSVVDGIPQIEVLPYFNNNVINTEYQDGATAPLRVNQEYSKINK